MPSSYHRHASAASIAVLFAVVLGLCLLRAVRLGSADLSGASSYIAMADSLLRDGMLSVDGRTPTAYRMPAYAVVVAVAKLIAGGYWSQLLIFAQGAASIAVGVLWNSTARRLTGSWWIPALVTLTYAGHLTLQAEHLALRETVLFGLLVAWFFHLASSKSVGPRTLCAMTLACVLAFYTRPTGFVMIIPLLGIIALRAGWSIRLRSTYALLAVGGFALSVVPWQAYQTVITGELILAPTPVGGQNLFKGNSLSFEYVAPYVDVDGGEFLVAEAAAEGLRGEDGAKRDKAADDHLHELASADIRADRGRYLRKAVLRVLAYLSPLETPLGAADVVDEAGQLRLNDYQGNFVKASRYWLPFAQSATLFFVALFAIPLGLLANLKHCFARSPLQPFAVATFLFLGANIGIYALTAAETRYRLYLDPLFVLWAWLAIPYLFGWKSSDAGPAR